MTHTLRILLPLSFLALTGLGGAFWLLLQLQESEKRYHARVGRIAAPYVHAKPAQGMLLGRLGDTVRAIQLRELLAWPLGLDLAQSDQYPLPWWAVLVVAAALSLIGAQVIAGVFGKSLVALFPVLWLFVSRFVFSWFQQRRSEALYRQFPDALGMIVRSVRVGIPVGEAIRMVARESQLPTSAEFGRLADQVAIGIPLDEALQQMAVRTRLAEYRFFATALALQTQTGGGLAETLDGLADVIRKRVALRARGRALASEARTSAGVLTALPVLTGLALWVLNPSYFMILFADPGGNKILAAAIGMLGSGTIIMRAMITRSLS